MPWPQFPCFKSIDLRDRDFLHRRLWAYQQEFCRRQWPALTFINREQDLGEEGLRERLA